MELNPQSVLFMRDSHSLVTLLELMPTPYEIDQQVQLEREQIAKGIKRLNDTTRKLEDKAYASATIYGVASIDELLPIVRDSIDETKKNLKSRKNGVAFKEINKYLDGIESLALACIACKVTWDQCFSSDEEDALLTNIRIKIGRAVEDECQMRYYESTAGGLLNSIKENYWHRACGTRQKLTVTQTIMNRCDVKSWDTWGNVNRTKIGNWLLDHIMKVSGWFQIDKRYYYGKTPYYLMPSPSLLRIKDSIMKESELFAPLTWAMLVPPNDWSNERKGGYLLNEVMRGQDLVRRGNDTLKQGDLPIACLNKIQRVGYRLNPFVVEVAKVLEERGFKVGKFQPLSSEELPPKPPNIAADKDVRKTYRRMCAEVHNRNANAFRESCRTRMTLEVMRKFEDKTFYIPWSLDYRGRMYPLPSFITPQGTDFDKSLMRFHRESYLTPEAEMWLAFQVATTYGLDKSTMKERQVWVKENYELITQVALDPIDNLPLWEDVDEPWQFLAACEEYYWCVIDGWRQYTGLMIGVDATASGLQILAGLTKDMSTAKLTNVYPSDKPQDAYKVVSDLARPDCPEHLQPYIDRKVSKRLVMTIPYSAKFQSNKEYVEKSLVDDHNLDSDKGDYSKDDVKQITYAMRAAVESIFPGPIQVMKWIEKETSKALKKVDHLEWTTQSGFKVYQRYNHIETEKLNLQLMGSRSVPVVAVGTTDKPNKSKHRNATSPNLIHSQDASLLHFVVNQFNAPIALIHDSVLARATDMSELSSLVRETYTHLFAEHDYLSDFAQQIGAETEPPIIGDLEPSDVIESTYFFC